jgi:hypothetical protein
MAMKWGKYSFGSLQINDEEYTKDVILDRGIIRQRKKKASREFRERFGHTPISLKEDIPWECKRLVIGTGMQGQLPVMEEVRTEAQRRGVEIIACPTREAIELLRKAPEETNAILHLTC